jgi:hypothetical protein
MDKTNGFVIILEFSFQFLIVALFVVFHIIVSQVRSNESCVYKDNSR